MAELGVKSWLTTTLHLLYTSGTVAYCQFPGLTAHQKYQEACQKYRFLNIISLGILT